MFLWILGLVGVALLWGIYLSVVLAWGDQKTNGLSYYGLSPQERDRFKRILRLHAWLLLPPLRLLGRLSNFDFANASFRFEGISGPKGTCTENSFAAGHRYVPRPEDVFVVTQMKCGTTWMQHLVYQVLLRGRGDLVESGRTLYAVSPWLEAIKSVPVLDAPTVGAERPARIIKTHFPAPLCPQSPDAKYIYVARHPVSCFASCSDFIAANLGSFRPELPVVEEWFCADQAMWWGTWPEHVGGWWDLAQERDNVLFVRFEDMIADLAAVAREVADFLGMRALAEKEMADVLEKCGFDYMRRNETTFEMHPPHLLAVDATLFVSGSSTRHEDVPDEVRMRIMDWSEERIARHGFPMQSSYPNVDPAAR